MFFEIILLVTLCGVQGHVSWGAWSEWTTSCSRSCSDMFGLQRRHRICLICQTENDCFPASRPTSVSLCIGQYQETRQCYIGSECNGQGRFTGEWTSWQEFGPCMTTSPGCDVPGQQYQIRSCVSSTDSKLSSDVQCPLGDDAHTFRLTECVKVCPMEKTARKRHTTTNASLFWSMWSDWRCEGPCLLSKTAVRHRKCSESESNSNEHCSFDAKDNIYYDIKPCLANDVSLCAQTTTKSRLTRPDLLSSEISVLKNARVKREEDVDGNWGEWGEWTPCSVTCHWCERIRYRQCDSPAPQGNGKLCDDYGSETKFILLGKCPVNGNWGSWTHFTCVVSCGSGIKVRYRECNNPRERDAGKPCAGLNKDVADEPCSTIACPQHSIAVALPENVRKLIKDQLQNIWIMYDRRSKRQLEKTRLRCQGEVFETIRYLNEYSSVIWTLNGDPLPRSFKFQLISNGGDLIIWGIERHDQGVYMCQMEWAPGMRATVAIASVVIVTNAKMYVREGDNVELPCNGAPLGITFSHLKQYWFHNGGIYKDYGSTPPQLANVEYFKNVQSWFGGLWECVVSEVNTDRRWITNRVNIVVLPTTLIQKLFPDQLHFYLIIAFAAIVIIALLTCCIYLNRKSDIEAQEEAKLFETILAERGSGKEDQEENANLTDDSMSDTSADGNDGVPLLDGGTVHRDTLPQI